MIAQSPEALRALAEEYATANKKMTEMAAEGVDEAHAQKAVKAWSAAMSAYRAALTPERVIALCKGAGALKQTHKYFGNGKYGKKYERERKVLDAADKALTTIQAAFIDIQKEG